MGLPQVQVEFINKAREAMKISGSGVVALVLKDDTAPVVQNTFIYNSIDELKEESFTKDNVDYIKKAFMGVPGKIIIERVPTTAENFNEVLSRLKNKKWNYLSIPQITKEQVTDIATWIKSMRDNTHKTFKAVLPDVDADHEGVINFCTDKIKTKSNDKVYSAAEYCARIAGILAGLPFTKSATYYVLPEVESMEESVEPDKDIDAGKLILINDGEKIKIGSGVNSLTTISGDKGIDMKDILIIEKMDFVMDTIRNTFQDQYVGKVLNNYDNKFIFIVFVNDFFKNLTRDYEFFDRNEESKVDIDVIGNKLYLEGLKKDTSKMKEEEIKKANTGKNVFLTGKVRFTNTMQDLKLKIYM
jgi:hypothetical protein